MENQEVEIKAIIDVVENYYFKGIYEGDEMLLGSIFHPGSLLFGDVKGQPYFKTVDLYLDGVKNRQSPKDSGKPFKGEILNIKVVNSIAIAEINVKMYDFNYRDFLSFHKIDGKWIIVNKMLTDISE
ncbi:nuclear transport factor 2 family protein [uncultured Flavobacterium sp.]|uniref:nuclear transport factor 2 family protein n=1 Tax=uncultured Flavobacterium sp. TaxID=165435 RepID=UPI00308199C7